MMRAAKSKQPKSKSARKESERQRLDKALEEGLQETFPASDALAITGPRRRHDLASAESEHNLRAR